MRPRYLHLLQVWLSSYLTLELILTCFFCRDSTFSILSLLFIMFCLLPITFKLSAFLSAASYCFLSVSLLTSASFLCLSSSTLFYLAALLSFSLFLFSPWHASVPRWKPGQPTSTLYPSWKQWKTGAASHVLFFQLKNRRKSWKILEKVSKIKIFPK